MHPLPLLCLSGGGGVGEPPTKFSKRDSLIEPLQGGGGLVGVLEGVAVKASLDLEYLMINKNVFNFNF